MTRRSRLTSYGILSLFFFSPALFAADWKAVDAAFEYRKNEVASGHFFRLDPKRWRVDLLMASDYGTVAMTAERYRDRSKAALVINGGFFDEAFRSLGLLQRHGGLVNPLRKASWGIFLLNGREGRTPLIVPQKEWKPDQVAMAIQVGPRLVIGGEIPSFKEEEPSRRSAIGVTRDGRVLIGLADAPISLRQWAEMLREDCDNALNLDGGGSSQISVELNGLSLNVTGLTGVPNAIAIFH